jgi:tripartite-type tricarboxylate transporter receptor subunit TctC
LVAILKKEKIMNKFKRVIFFAANIALTILLTTQVALAQENFPSRPIRIIAPYTAGTGADVLSRILAQAMSPILGQSIIVENRAGAGGMLGTDFGAKAPADGYTLTMATPGTLIIIPAMNRNAKYVTERDFVAIGTVALSAYVVVTSNTSDSPQNFQELLTSLKAKGGSYGIPGIGSTTHLAAEVVLSQAGVKATPVPYPGSSQMLTDVSSGQVGFGFNTVGATLPLVKGGKLRALAVTSASRVGTLPSVPSMTEVGLAGLNLVGWWGLVAPIGTPPEVVKKLSEALIKALNTADVKSKLASQEVEPFPLSSAAYAALIRKETPLWTDLVRENKLTAD